MYTDGDSTERPLRTRCRFVVAGGAVRERLGIDFTYRSSRQTRDDHVVARPIRVSTDEIHPRDSTRPCSDNHYPWHTQMSVFLIDRDF